MKKYEIAMRFSFQSTPYILHSAEHPFLQNIKLRQTQNSKQEKT